ncbi:hypothetical protein GCM10027082_01380 [Comamonas humi]
MSAGSERRFMAAVNAFGFAARDLEPCLRRMDAWLSALTEELHTHRLRPVGLRAGSALARQAQAIDAAVQAGFAQWKQAWARQAPAHSLARAFEDRAIFLVFGKFNAGKSSLCNFLADRFRQQGSKVRYFYLEAGQVCETPERFQEGATETTARLQGVCLGERLVLLDTPGLHSATAENAALTLRFLDSADAVLWLTSSTSPGQVQELDELAYELRRHKPLLPIVTRSDCLEEDEVDGEIRKLLLNKSESNRALQEADVQARAREKLREMGMDAALLKAPLSISVQIARAQGETAEALAGAGFERLYGALLELAGPVLAYQQRKPAEVRLHHLEEDVLGSLQAQVLPALAALGQALNEEDGALEQQQERIVKAAWRSVVPELPQLLERYADSQDAGAVCAEVSQWVSEAVERQLQEHLGCYELSPVAPVAIELDASIGYETAMAGDTVAVGYERLHAALESAVHASLLQLAAEAVGACHAYLQALAADAGRLHDTVLVFGQRLQGMARELRPGAVA